MMNVYAYSCIILSIFSFISCKSTCNNLLTCGQCIGHATERCAWIAKEPFPELDPRCQPEVYAKSLGIEENLVHQPTSHLKRVDNETFSSSVQFLPREIHIRASPGVTVNFSMRYQPAKDFPVDVYFLMDYSDTMAVHKNALQQQSKLIYDGLLAITQNVRLGVGSFIEKPALPYTDKIGNQNHKSTYLFKNHLNLTKNMQIFEKVVNDSTFGGNYDDAEAGLEALMQVMTCDSIGWNNVKRRRIIVLATDSTYHSAGDGKMAGAFIPNDMQCHLNGDIYSTEQAITHDYPSVSQIDKIAWDNKFKIIFAAIKDVEGVYTALASRIRGAKYAVLADTKATKSNILDIIIQEYQKSVDYIKLYRNYKDDIDDSAPLELDLHQKCPETEEDDPRTKIENCKISPLNPSVDIPASIKSTKCAPPGTKYTVNVSPSGLQEELKIVFEVDCQCKCETDIVKDRSTCNDHGYKQCGICNCDKNRGGKTCEHDCEGGSNETISSCYLNENDKDVCNGRGRCKCGRCEDCDPDFSGKYCQFDIKSCKNRCSGNGLQCVLGQCQCKMGWTKDDCSCSTDPMKCMAPFSAKECSGRGHCECGRCFCDKVPGTTDERYMGKFCDKCEECAKERCEDLKEYASCNYIKSKVVCDAELNRSNGTTVKEVNRRNKTEFESILSAPCKIVNDDGYFLLFKFDADYLVLDIQNELEPPPKASIWIACGSAIGAIILIGIMTAIIWKILINMYDKREYEKFCNEAKAQGYDVSENPLYSPPTQSFVNPGFTQSNIDR